MNILATLPQWYDRGYATTILKVNETTIRNDLELVRSSQPHAA